MLAVEIASSWGVSSDRYDRPYCPSTIFYHCPFNGQGRKGEVGPAGHYFQKSKMNALKQIHYIFNQENYDASDEVDSANSHLKAFLLPVRVMLVHT